jgi:MFS family permease
MSLRRYRAILRTPQVPRLVSASVLGRLPLGMVGLALVLLVRHAGGSFGLAGLTAGSFSLGAGVVAPLMGRIADRNGQTAVLVPCALVCTAAFGALALVAGTGPSSLLPAISAIAGATMPPISACMRVLWSSLLGRGAELQTAFALEATVQELIYIIGPLLVVGLIALASPTAAMLAIAAAVLTGTCLFAATPASRTWRPSGGRRDWAGALRAAGVRTLLGVIGLVAVSFGMIEVCVPAVAEHLGNSALSGLFLALWSGGSMIGGLVAGALTSERPVERRVVVLLGLVAVGLTPLVVAMTAVLPFAACMVLAGLGVAPAIACLYLLVDRSAPAGAVTEAFTWMTSAITAGIAGGSALAGVIVQHAGPRAALLLALCAAGAAVLLARIRRPTLAASPQPALGTEGA